jgi:hypothetical protein
MRVSVTCKYYVKLVVDGLVLPIAASEESHYTELRDELTQVLLEDQVYTAYDLL